MTTTHKTPQTPPAAAPPTTPSAPSKKPSQITALATPQYVHLACDLSDAEVTKPSRCNANRKPGDGSPPGRLHRPGHSCPCAPKPQDSEVTERADNDEPMDDTPCPRRGAGSPVPNLPSFDSSSCPPREDSIPSNLQLLQDQLDSQLGQSPEPAYSPATTTHLVDLAKTIATQPTTPNQNLNGIISVHDSLAVSNMSGNSEEMRRNSERLLTVLKEIHGISGPGVEQCVDILKGNDRGFTGNDDIEMSE